ncbi:MAG: transposase [SAR324 cluster bacterium]|nr:transposase [SAR324 cluster bacterium]
MGLDVGLKSVLATSDEQFIENPSYIREAEKSLKTKQRDVSRKKLRLNNRKKAVRILANQHEKVKNSRKNFHHQTARNIVIRYDKIFVENLNVKGMIQNHHLAKSISDAGWTSFLNILITKAESAGREVIQVNPRNTSQMCSGCGKIVKKTLAIRQHSCPSCGLSIDSDVNAALNIKRLGLSLCGEVGLPAL